MPIKCCGKITDNDVLLNKNKMNKDQNPGVPIQHGIKKTINFYEIY